MRAKLGCVQLMVAFLLVGDEVSMTSEQRLCVCLSVLQDLLTELWVFFSAALVYFWGGTLGLHGSSTSPSKDCWASP